MQEIQIRRATPGDCPRLLELVRGLALYEKAPEQVTITPEEFGQAGFGPEKVWDCFVAQHGEKTIGFALYYTRFSTWKGRRVYLEDLFVEPEYRGMGAGKLLFEALIEETRRLGFGGMVWQALDWNEPALAFYRRYGTSFDNGWVNCSLDIPSANE
ncbi:MAG: GNAT family N-acetyltransferase [Rikenellaceae bacterium]|nr:GNAT family N-acetyltransferase [Rikenellaceae bacterium]